MLVTRGMRVVTPQGAGYVQDFDDDAEIAVVHVMYGRTSIFDLKDLAIDMGDEATAICVAAFFDSIYKSPYPLESMSLAQRTVPDVGSMIPLLVQIANDVLKEQNQ